MEKAEAGLQGFVGRVRGFHDSLPGWLSFSGELSSQNFLLGLIPVGVLGTTWSAIRIG